MRGYIKIGGKFNDKQSLMYSTFYANNVLPPYRYEHDLVPKKSLLLLSYCFHLSLNVYNFCFCLSRKTGLSTLQ